jgi:hypothetical protein
VRHGEFTQEYIVSCSVVSWNDIKFNLAFQTLPQSAYFYVRVYSFKKSLMSTTVYLVLFLGTGQCRKQDNSSLKEFTDDK